jgi:hypothetical protein
MNQRSLSAVGPTLLRIIIPWGAHDRQSKPVRQLVPRRETAQRSRSWGGAWVSHEAAREGLTTKVT